MHRPIVLAAFALLLLAGDLVARDEATEPLTPRDLHERQRTGSDARILHPQKIHHVDPVYTDLALEAGIQGVVMLEVTIDEEGRVREPLILDGLGYGLDEAAIAAVSQWRFKPASVDGRPVAVRWRVTQNFRLPRGFTPDRRRRDPATVSDCPATYSTLPELFEPASTIFLGRVRDVEPDPEEAIDREASPGPLVARPERWLARVEVLEVFKGSDSMTFRVFERRPVSERLVRLEPGGEYLFFLRDEPWPTVCSGTQQVGRVGFERGEAWVAALRKLAEEGGSIPVSPWYLDSNCVARVQVGSRDGGTVRFAVHRVGSDRARVLVGAWLGNSLAVRPSGIVLELGRYSFPLRRPWDVWGSPPGDIVWGFDSWALDARTGGDAWSSLTRFDDIGVSVLQPNGEPLFHQSLDAPAFERIWNAALACKPALELGSSFVFNP